MGPTGRETRRRVQSAAPAVLLPCPPPDINHRHDVACWHFSRGRVIMNVADILRIKGSTVKTVTSDETALGLSHKLRIEHIGAMIVSNDGKSIDGIISERDLAYGLAAYGSQLPRMAVSKLMTKVVVTCSPEDSITDAMKLMTQRRVRHLPVKDGDQLVGIISIGDVLKHRLGEVELEVNVLRDYAIAARR
jgi:CBS domain-containing protein